MAETTSAPTPWTIEHSTTGSGQVIRVADANGRDIRASAIGSTTAAEGSRTTEEIVRAVNAHDALVRIVREMTAEMGDDDVVHMLAYGEAFARGRALIASLDADAALTHPEA